MTYSSTEARQRLLQWVAGAAEELGVALAYLGEAYEQLDENTAERLEQELFRPVQMAYGRAQRTCSEFASRHGLAGHRFQPASETAPSKGVKGSLDSAVDAVARADAALATLQDSMLPVEVGDTGLRAGLQETRRLLGDVREHARGLMRTLGR
jgi:hypothetical protein